jgi:hypothetical protein
MCVCVCVYLRARARARERESTEVDAEISFDTEVASGDAGVIEAHVAHQREESLERLGLLHGVSH